MNFISWKFQEREKEMEELKKIVSKCFPTPLGIKRVDWCKKNVFGQT